MRGQKQRLGGWGGRRLYDQRHGSPAEARKWPPETREAKEIKSLLESPEGTNTPPTP